MSSYLSRPATNNRIPTQQSQATFRSAGVQQEGKLIFKNKITKLE
jgi:hypothetical protein